MRTHALAPYIQKVNVHPKFKLEKQIIFNVCQTHKQQHIKSQIKPLAILFLQIAEIRFGYVKDPSFS